MTELSSGRIFEIYGDRANRACPFFSPGRVNLIGEHTDYNGGYVFPCALDVGTSLLVRKSDRAEIVMSSLNFTGEIVVPIVLNYLPIPKSWTNYPVGVINEFARKGICTPGAWRCSFTVTFQTAPGSPPRHQLRWLRRWQ
ncbi:MAG: hypothetical protein MZV63_23265 [Marinilabiliales bacterium]|nr:hypothetical protein [Marinilabiliales bacterium]